MEDERKTYLILGASSDVAMTYIRSLAAKYRKNGKNPPLILAHYAKNAGALKQLARDCCSLEFVLIKADLSVEEQAISLINQVEKHVKYPNYILHFPAPTFDYMRYKELNTDQIRTSLNIQVFSFLTITRRFLPLMHKEFGNRVVVMLSSYVTTELPPKFMVDYVTVKYALLGAMKAAAAEYGNKNLKINGISPIMMETKFLEKLDSRILEMNRMQSRLGRIPTPEEILPYIEQLLSASCEKNGYNLCVDEALLEGEDKHFD